MELRPQNNPKDPDLLDPAPTVQKQRSVSRSLQTPRNPLLGRTRIPQTSDTDTERPITALIIDFDAECCAILKKWLNNLFPELIILGMSDGHRDARKVLVHRSVDLVFSKSVGIDAIKAELPAHMQPGFILMSGKPEDAIHALRNHLHGFLLMPLERDDVAISIRCALDNIHKTRTAQKTHVAPVLPHTKLVGVPTIEGIEFMDTEKIVRCEGLQKCTLIVTTERCDIISSYSIGKFRELLGDRGFFACHRSHHINLRFVQKYTREGYIYFNAKSKPVPLARRRKCDFLNQIRHL